MTLQPLKGFQPLRTHHCVTGSMRHVYEFHKYPISEDLLLGLGAGVGFVYWHMKGTVPFFGGRANVGRPGEEGLEKTTGKRTGVRIEPHRTVSARKAEAAVLDLLEAGEPVMVQLDMGSYRTSISRKSTTLAVTWSSSQDMTQRLGRCLWPTATENSIQYLTKH